MIPPISAPESPFLLLEDPVAAVLAIAVGAEVTFGMRLDATATVSVGAEGVRAVRAAVVIVTVFERASVVVMVCVQVKVEILVV